MAYPFTLCREGVLGLSEAAQHLHSVRVPSVKGPFQLAQEPLLLLCLVTGRAAVRDAGLLPHDAPLAPGDVEAHQGKTGPL